MLLCEGQMTCSREADALAFAANIRATLGKVHARVPDMVLVHGSDSKGIDLLALSWAERDWRDRAREEPGRRGRWPTR
jgi:hypothetical protein